MTQTPLCEHDETLTISLIEGATSIQYDQTYTDQLINFDETTRFLTLHANETERHLMTWYKLRITGYSEDLSSEIEYNLTVSHPCERSTITLENTRTEIGYVVGFSSVIHEIPYSIDTQDCGNMV